ncbi:hypothetical protein VPHK397_0123 [Vibrio phage K397]
MTGTVIAAVIGFIVIHVVNVGVQHVYILNRPEKHENLITASLKCDYVALGAMFLLGVAIFLIESGVIS